MRALAAFAAPMYNPGSGVDQPVIATSVYAQGASASACGCYAPIYLVVDLTSLSSPNVLVNYSDNTNAIGGNLYLSAHAYYPSHSPGVAGLLVAFGAANSLSGTATSDRVKLLEVAVDETSGAPTGMNQRFTYSQKEHKRGRTPMALP